MRIFLSIIIVVALMLMRSGYALESALQDTRLDKVKSDSICPATDFSEFLNAFVDSEELQHLFTMMPLKWQQLDLDAEPEPKQVLRILDSQEIKFPLIPSPSERRAKSLTLKIEYLSDHRAKVVLDQSDTDYQVFYFFSKNACWRLERIEDWSL